MDLGQTLWKSESLVSRLTEAWHMRRILHVVRFTFIAVLINVSFHRSPFSHFYNLLRLGHCELDVPGITQCPRRANTTIP